MTGLKSSVKIIFVFSLIVSGEAARILAAWPFPSISHQVAFRPIVQELAKRGHEVVVLTTNPAFPKGQAPKNIREIDLQDVSYNIWNKFVKARLSNGRSDDWRQKQMFICDWMVTIFEEQMKTDEVQELLKDPKQFDLLMVEAMYRPAIALSHVFKVPLILVSSFGSFPDNLEVIGAPTHPLLYPSYSHQRLYNLTFWEKIGEVYDHIMFDINFYNHYDIEDEGVKRIFGPDTPSLKELNNNVDMLFLNVNPIWAGNPPVPPSVIYMGGLPEKQNKELPQDLKSYLDSSKHGVIYFSLGTNVHTSLLPREKLQAFMNVFAKLPYDVLWKFEDDELPGKSDNIKLGKWFPQNDLLRHPKVKLFITQGGLQSTDEALSAGVPLIAIPILGDQWYNAEKYVYHKIGVRVDLGTLTEEKLSNAINTIINDDSYRQNVVKLNSLIRDQPQRPLERAVWWTEHVLRHGGARHLRAPAANMSWAEYLELKLVSALLFAFIVILIALILLVKFIWNLLFVNRKFKSD